MPAIRNLDRGNSYQGNLPPIDSIVSRSINSPVGRLKLIATAQGLAAVLWPHDTPRRVRLAQVTADDRSNPFLTQGERQLNEYFLGRRTGFTLALDFAGTGFQRRVWNALLTIPYGETRSYAQIARQIGCPAAVRAVGAANGRNPISIIAPCHRVVGSDGTLTGFAGGLERKAWLLALERQHPDTHVQSLSHQHSLMLATTSSVRS